MAIQAIEAQLAFVAGWRQSRGVRFYWWRPVREGDTNKAARTKYAIVKDRRLCVWEPKDAVRFDNLGKL
jgi:hypothetical protein